MKIAVYYNLDYGGAKRSVQEQVKGLIQLGHVVDVYTIDQKTDNLSPSIFANKHYEYNFEPLNIPIPFISRIASDLSVFIALKNLHRKIASDIDKRRYDIVLSHADFYTQAPFINRFLKTKSVYYVLEPLRIAYEYRLRIPSSWSFPNKVYETLNRYIRKKIDTTNARSATFSLAISYLGKFYAAQVYDIYPKVSYLGVDGEKFKPLNLTKKKQVLFVAPKDDLFGFDLITSALKLIPKNIRPELKIIFGAKEKVRISDQEVVRECNQSIAVLSLSRLDTFGLVPLESMACGVPVIATDMLGYKEIIEDGKTGFFVDFEPKDIADKITFIIKNPAVAREMGRRGRKTVEEKWTWEKRIKDLEKQLLEFSNSK